MQAIDSPSIVRILTDRINRTDFAASNAAQATLRQVGEAALPGLIEVISQPEGENLALHWEAVNALGEMGELPVMQLAALLRDVPLDAGARWAVAETLGYIGPPAGAALRDLLGHPDPEVNRVVLYALISIPDAQTVPLAADLLDNPDPDIRLAAIKALKAVGNQEAAAILKQVSDGIGQQAIRWAIAHCTG